MRGEIVGEWALVEYNVAPFGICHGRVHVCVDEAQEISSLIVVAIHDIGLGSDITCSTLVFRHKCVSGIDAGDELDLVLGYSQDAVE